MNKRNDKYKRKFLVPGDTPKKDVCNECYYKHNEYPCIPWNISINKVKWKDPSLPQSDNCIIPDKAFNKYLVTETLDGKWLCACPRGKFRRVNGESTCHHVDKAKQQPEKYEVPLYVTVNKIKIAESL